MPRWNCPATFVVFDTETTGLDSNVERLTEIGAVYVENGKINEEKKFCTFVNPGKPIPQKVVDLTGINDAMVADAPSPEGSYPRLQGVLWRSRARGPQCPQL